MTVISFNFTKITAERSKGTKGKLNISNNISIKDIKEAEKQWKKDKKIPKEIVEEMMSHILSKCNIEALLMSREINLPPPIPLPKVKSN